MTYKEFTLFLGTNLLQLFIKASAVTTYLIIRPETARPRDPHPPLATAEPPVSAGRTKGKKYAHGE